jgi:hypothetical protein
MLLLLVVVEQHPTAEDLECCLSEEVGLVCQPRSKK